MVVGNGVWAFCFTRICSREPNRLDYCGDVLVRRINKDWPDVRFHLQQARQRKTGYCEALPVYGC